MFSVRAELKSYKVKESYTLHRVVRSSYYFWTSTGFKTIKVSKDYICPCENYATDL